jgi:hypothetical protein
MLIAMCSLGCQTISDIAKQTATEIYERERPKIQAAISSMKERAISEAKTLATEVKEQAIEKAVDLAEAKAEELRDRGAKIQANPEAGVLDQLKGAGMIEGGNLLALLALLFKQNAAEKRKEKRDEKWEIEERLKAAKAV